MLTSVLEAITCVTDLWNIVTISLVLTLVTVTRVISEMNTVDVSTLTNVSLLIAGVSMGIALIKILVLIVSVKMDIPRTKSITQHWVMSKSYAQVTARNQLLTGANMISLHQRSL